MALFVLTDLELLISLEFFFEGEEDQVNKNVSWKEK